MTDEAICWVCAFLGRYIPWAMIVVGGLMSAVAYSDSWGRASAWLLAGGLGILLVSYFLNRLVPTRPAH